RDIRDPCLVSPGHRELALQKVGDHHGRLADRPAPGAVAVQGTQTIHAHEASDAMLTARLAGLSQVEKDARRAVDALTRVERCSDKAKQPSILLGAVRYWLLEPCVVAGSRDAQQPTHPLHAKRISIGLDEFVRRSGSPRA